LDSICIYRIIHCQEFSTPRLQQYFYTISSKRGIIWSIQKFCIPFSLFMKRLNEASEEDPNLNAP
jgi:hypothetical protein